MPEPGDPGSLTERVEAALRAAAASGQVDDLGHAGDWTIEQLTGGWSRATFLVAHRHDERRRLIVRAQPRGGLLETKIDVEHRTYEALRGKGVPVPAPLGYEPSEHTAFGGPFFVMSWVEGAAYNVWDKADRATLEADWEAGGAIAESLVQTLASIHEVPPASFSFLGEHRGLRASASRWEEIYRQQAMVRDPVVEAAFAWLQERPEGDAESVLVHGDFRIGNTLVHDRHVRAIIDWELAHVGDFHHDLGWLALEYLGGRFLEPASGLLGGVAEREWLLARYEALTGRSVDRELLRSYTVLAAAGLSGILCTGLSMFHAGRTDDLRMVWNRFALPVLRADLIRLMEW